MHCEPLTTRCHQARQPIPNEEPLPTGCRYGSMGSDRSSGSTHSDESQLTQILDRLDVIARKLDSRQGSQSDRSSGSIHSDESQLTQILDRLAAIARKLDSPQGSQEEVQSF